MADEWEDESLVLVELTTAKDLQLLKADTIQAQILGPSTEQPVMLINGSTFAGRYEDSLGTTLVLQERTTPVSKGPFGMTSQPSQSLEFVCKTDKKLIMHRTFLQDKTSTVTSAQPTDEAPVVQDDTIHENSTQEDGTTQENSTQEDGTQGDGTQENGTPQYDGTPQENSTQQTGGSQDSTQQADSSQEDGT